METNTQGNQIRRNGRGANSLGAADSAVTTPMASGVMSPLATSNETSAAYSEKNLSLKHDEEDQLVNLTSTLHVSPFMTPSKSEVTLMAFSSSSDLVTKTGVSQASGLILAPQCIAVSPSLNRTAEVGPVFSTSSVSKLDIDNSFGEEVSRKMFEHVAEIIVVDNDSDLEIETEVPPLESVLSWEVLRHLKPKEKKRQEVINELFHTERTHVRNLKILYKIFYRPLVMLRIESPQLIRLLFGNLNELLMVHQEMYKKMRQALAMWKQQFAAGTFNSGYINDGASDTGGSVASAPASIAASTSNLTPPYGNIGELIQNIFDGKTGENLMRETAMFCQNQQHALDTLRQK